jgi:hypothetical protein
MIAPYRTLESFSELVSEGTSKIPTTKTPMITKACRP